jgi:hypothetical protein
MGLCAWGIHWAVGGRAESSWAFRVRRKGGAVVRSWAQKLLTARLPAQDPALPASCLVMFQFFFVHVSIGSKGCGYLGDRVIAARSDDAFRVAVR